MTHGQNNLIVDSGISERIDKYLHRVFPDYSRTFLQEMVSCGKVKLNGHITTKKTIVSEGNQIEIQWPEKIDSSLLLPEDFNFTILYEDDDLLVIDKPAGIVVHPAAGNHSGTVVNALLGRDENFIENVTEENADELSLNRPGIVHRLDKDTSGCLVIAKNVVSKAKLSESFSSRKVNKIYKAIVIGKPPKQREKIETLIGRHHIHRQKMAVVNHNGRDAITIYDLVRSFVYKEVTLSLLDVQILTGRTHQIRVHLAHKKLPVLGDKIYGGKQSISAPRQMLHAWKIEFPHPSTNELLSIECPLPEDFQKFIEP
ncbi:MAG TPA: RluA family pseudouridine synthase [Lentisphaeria bacterium]|nr:MAG: hypothetical protein A2X47_04910 [Lentisphaerae bacterium GWF2_38_69]HBM16333.1 RluA family pseudouridine synthase [Lentisphaeria bacterium]